MIDLDATKRPRQRWLVIAHAFNMDGRAASQTITDKLPHLRREGIEVVVLSGVSGILDSEYEHHQLWPFGPVGIRFELRHVLQRILGKGFSYRLLIFLASLFLFPWMLLEKIIWPVESTWSWWLSAYLKGRLLARDEPFDLIYSSGGAFSAHLAAHALKKGTGTPWLAEIHDPLVMPGQVPTSRQQKLQAKVEQLVCANADVAVWFTDQALVSARLRHPELGDRGKVLLPGIDKPFVELPPYQSGKKFVIGHFGSLSSTRHLGPIIEAITKLLKKRPELIEAIEVHVFGGPLDEISSRIISESGVGNIVRHFGRIEADIKTGLSGRQKILHRMRAVDVLLLLHGQDDICAEYIPSKLYEYLWMQRPILAVVHKNSQMDNLIAEQGHTVVSTYGDTSVHFGLSTSLANEVEQLFDRWSFGGLADSGRVSPYTTERAVKSLLSFLNIMNLPNHAYTLPTAYYGVSIHLHSLRGLELYPMKSISFIFP